MDEKRLEIVDTGLLLLESGLVARTWGNVSARADATHFFITPSGLDYTLTKPEDIVLYDMSNETYEGKYKPSGEKGVHAAAYELFPEVNFVIHTHQTYASAIGVYGFDELDITNEEQEKLGGIALAEYGLPGTKKLKNAVRSYFEKGAHTVLMQHHGAIVAGASKEDALEKINLLEEICRRNCKGLVEGENAAVTCAKKGIRIKAQLDDMAQMSGRIIPLVNNADEGLEKYNAVIVQNIGPFVKGQDSDDTKALEILVEKAAVTALHTKAYGVNKKLSFFDCAIMHFVYKQKYSKKKAGV